MLLLVLVAGAIIISVPYVLGVLLYSFPLLLIWLMTTAQADEEPLLHLDPSSYPQLAQLRAEKREVEERYDEVRYADWGIRWSDKLGRFEERSVRGRELNEQLEYWTAEFDRIDSEIDEIEAPERKLVWAWRKDLLAWSRKQAEGSAKIAGSKMAFLAFGGVWIGVELLGLAFPGLVELFAFAWNPAPTFLHPGIAIGAAAGWAAGLNRMLNPSKTFVRLASERMQDYEHAKKVREQAEDEETAQQPRDRSFENDSEVDDGGNDECEQMEPWYVILGVSADATRSQINEAHRYQIKQYHPDRVSGLGEKLQMLAKVESQRLNAAREEGLSLQG